MSQEKVATKVEHQRITAGSLVKRVRWNGSSQEIWIQNLHATKDAKVSFDGSDVDDADKEWWTIQQGTVHRLPLKKSELHIQRAEDTDCILEILVFLENY